MVFASLLIISFVFSKGPVDDKSPFQVMLEKNQDLKTREGTVQIEGVTYKKIEADGKHYYFKVLQRQEAIPIYLCERPEGYKSEHLVETSLKINQRKRVFFQALREKCSTRKSVSKPGSDAAGLPASNNKRTWVEVDPIVGIHIPDEKGDLINNKKVGIGLEDLLNVGSKKIQFMGDF